MFGMDTNERNRAIGMWGLAICLFVAAAGWIFMRFGQAWSVADLPESDNVVRIVPAYIIAEVAMIPLGAKLCDIIGCKRILSFAPAIFVLGSMMCILSTSVEMLIVFRFIQGLGAGLILGLVFTSVGRYYEKEKMGRCHELFSAAFAIGSLFGTAIGYFLTENFNWRMGFVVFSILMIVGTVMAWKFLPEDRGDSSKIDYIGMIFAMLAFGFVAFYTQSVNVDFQLISVPSLITLAAIIILIIVTMKWMKRSSNPVIPTGVTIFEKKLIILMFVFSLCGLGLIQYFFKLYLTYYEFDIYQASSLFIFLILGAAAPSLLGARKVLITGVRPWIFVGSIIVTLSLIVTHFIANQGVLQFALSVFLFGLGLGFIVVEIIISTQSVIRKEEMGKHTGNLMAVRMVGILAGNAVVGSYIKEFVHSGYKNEIINISTDSDLFSLISNRLFADIQYSASALSDGLMVSVVIMAIVTALLAVVAYTLGDDDKIKE